MIEEAMLELMNEIHSHYESMAQDLYNAGYRKVDGVHYVSMQWHEEQVWNEVS